MKKKNEGSLLFFPEDTKRERRERERETGDKKANDGEEEVLR